jgi:hypothetical protein
MVVEMTQNLNNRGPLPNVVNGIANQHTSSRQQPQMLHFHVDDDDTVNQQDLNKRLAMMANQ